MDTTEEIVEVYGKVHGELNDQKILIKLGSTGAGTEVYVNGERLDLVTHILIEVLPGEELTTLTLTKLVGAD